jgi:hypothetical protein
MHRLTPCRGEALVQGRKDTRFLLAEMAQNPHRVKDLWVALPNGYLCSDLYLTQHIESTQPKS